MSEEYRSPHEVTPTTAPELGGGPSGTGVRASSTAMTGPESVPAPMPATPFERAAAPAGQPAPAPVVGAGAPVVAPQAAVPEATGAPYEGPSEGPSPWFAQDQASPNVDASLLPSASLEFLPSSDTQADAPRPASTAPPKPPVGSRPALLIGLGVAAVLLLVAIIYVALSPSGAGDGPASVRVDSEGNEIEVDPDEEVDPAASASASASAEPTVRPRYRWKRPTAKQPSTRYVPDDL